ncbi:Flagellar hook-length control protein FliK [Tistlia consotensis]|uniref:Flagellar hook-length control protein FliK n=1 Tax=Tistlia consotensis USBA 355 TaxID=560819 RepID=A0A1Y6CJ31_9PROT|nr:flagellar hook-length control protein FliK [Tistlia consotensis]SMF67730.1 Flagellar hook-length control protein FliK [Tistlia consotensis USBA 355]SNR99605.1 Flagellar hook-length control protein FliK [Tistlia consotensis]
MDIQAVPASTPRPQDRAESGKSSSDKGFAALLGTMAGKSTDTPAPAKQPRQDDGRDDTAAADASTRHDRTGDRKADSKKNDAKSDAQNDDRSGAAAAEAAGSATPKPKHKDDGKADAAEAAQAAGEAAGQAGQPAQTQAAGAAQQAAQPPAQQPLAGQQAGAAQAAPIQTGAGLETARQATGQAPGQPLQQAAGQALQQAAAASAPAAAAGSFRLPGQDGSPRAQVRLDTASQPPRAALSGNTALAASLAASPSGSGQADPSGQAGSQGSAAAEAHKAGPQAAAKGADGLAAKAFAGLVDGAAANSQDQGPGGKTQVLQPASGSDILLPAGADAARVQAPQTAAATAPATPTPPAQAPLADQVAVQMHKALSLGKDRLTIQLHPAELGRVDIKLDLGGDGPVRAVLHAERKDTMDLLQRDSRGLERALQNAGLQTDGNSISFDLRGGGQQQRSGQGFAQQMPSTPQGRNDAPTDGGEVQLKPVRADARHDGAVNIRV